jgi:pimeloyl-ACP methyl ester carboxylesterase
MAENAEELAVLLADRAAGPATVVGHSYGAGIAILLAARHPSLVGGLVLVGPVGHSDGVTRLDHVLGWPIIGPVLAGIGLLASGRLLPLVRAVIQRVPGNALRAVEVSLPDNRFAHGGLRGRSVRRTFVAEQRALVREIDDVEAALDDIAVPTAVVAGAWDMVVRPAVASQLARSLRHGELVVVPRVGHFVPRDAPTAVIDAVRWVEACSPSGDERVREPSHRVEDG